MLKELARFIANLDAGTLANGGVAAPAPATSGKSRVTIADNALQVRNLVREGHVVSISASAGDTFVEYDADMADSDDDGYQTVLEVADDGSWFDIAPGQDDSSTGVGPTQRSVFSSQECCGRTCHARWPRWATAISKTPVCCPATWCCGPRPHFRPPRSRD